MAEYKHSDCLKGLGDAQDTEYDNREKMREAEHFLYKRDGQWEPEIIQRFNSKPRYTFDECGPIVDDIMGEMAGSEFAIKVMPAGGGADTDMAKAYEGIMRHIENISNASKIYLDAARIMVSTGLDGWRVVTGYRDDDSFQQDLMIKRIPNWVDSVWFDVGAVDVTMEDADHCWILSSLAMDDYKKRWPKGTGESVGSEMKAQVYSHKKPHEVTIAEYLYKKVKKRELALMTNGSVYEVDENFNKIKDELAAEDIEVAATREREYHVIYQKLLDGRDWLTDAKETVFQWLPIIPIWGNYKISESKKIYSGVVEKLMDPQRVLNYSESRRIEEVALNPRGKYWMTRDQAKSGTVRKTLRTLNTNTDPVQFYDWAEGQAAPTYQGNPSSNPGLSETSQSAMQYIQRVSGTFDEARGNAPSQRSGLAVGLLQNKSDNPKRKWFTSVEVGIQHTCRILSKAIPKVYDTKQQMRLVNQDGSSDSITVNEKVIDEDTGEEVMTNDLSVGQYDITCSSGPAFRNQQQQTINSIIEMAGIDPSILEIGADVLLNQLPVPGIDKIAERKRQQMIQGGMIPPTQMTEEESAAAEEAAQQPPEPDAMMVAAQAEQAKADADMAKVQTKNMENQVKAQLEMQKLRLKEMELNVKAQTEALKLEQNGQKQSIQALQAVAEQVRTQAMALKAIREAMGVETVVDQAAVRSFAGQARELAETIQTQ